MKNLFVRFVREDEGQDLVEYAMLVAFIAFIAIAGVTLFGGALNDWWTAVADGVGAFNTGAPADP
jgi:pilus assembly protein Flp/PilA